MCGFPGTSIGVRDQATFAEEDKEASNRLERETQKSQVRNNAPLQAMVIGHAGIHYYLLAMAIQIGMGMRITS